MSPLFTVQFPGRDYEAYLVIDTVYRNRSGGGVRIASDLDLAEVCDLAREMSLKYAFFGLPRGGAKAGIRLPTGVSKGIRDAAIEDFGRRLAPFIHGGVYYPGMDMNCGPQDLIRVYRGAGMEIGTPTDSSWFTAVSVASALGGTADFLREHPQLSLAVDGFGRVAGYLAGLLPAERFRIVAITTLDGATVNPQGWDPALLVKAHQARGDACVESLPGDRVTRDEVFSFPVDIFLPGARTRSLTTLRAKRLSARAVVPIANVAYDVGVSEMLHARGVAALPGYVVNGGGVFGTSLGDRGVGRTEIITIFERRHRPLVAKVLEVASRLRLSPVQVADTLSEKRLEARGSEVSASSWGGAIERRLRRRYPLRLKRVLARRECADIFDTLDSDLTSFVGV